MRFNVILIFCFLSAFVLLGLFPGHATGEGNGIMLQASSDVNAVNDVLADIEEGDDAEEEEVDDAADGEEADDAAPVIAVFTVATNPPGLGPAKAAMPQKSVPSTEPRPIRRDTRVTAIFEFEKPVNSKTSSMMALRKMAQPSANSV